MAAHDAVAKRPARAATATLDARAVFGPAAIKAHIGRCTETAAGKRTQRVLRLTDVVGNGFVAAAARRQQKRQADRSHAVRLPKNAPRCRATGGCPGRRDERADRLRRASTRGGNVKVQGEPTGITRSPKRPRRRAGGPPEHDTPGSRHARRTRTATGDDGRWAGAPAAWAVGEKRHRAGIPTISRRSREARGQWVLLWAGTAVAYPLATAMCRRTRGAYP